MTKSPPLVMESRGPDETRELGARLGRLLRPGDVVLLHGDLGAGKTTLTQGIARGLGVSEYVQSPTFTLVAQHDGRDSRGRPIRLYHLDLYRLTVQDELESFGFDEYLDPSDGISVIEWPERAGDWLPDRYLIIRLELTGPDGRRLTLESVPDDAYHSLFLRLL